MELVYLYVQEAYGEEYDLHLDFSQNTKVRFDKDTQKFSIEKLNNEYPLNFFGENIKNITAIVGRNGIGKSTVIDILSLLQKVRKGRERYKWLIVYEENSNFYLEGNIKDEILTGKKNKPDYLIKGYFKSGKFEPDYDHDFTYGKGINIKYIVPYSKEKEFSRELHGYAYRYLVEKSSLEEKFLYLSSPEIQEIFSINAPRKLQITLHEPQDVMKYVEIENPPSDWNVDKIKEFLISNHEIYKEKLDFSGREIKKNFGDNKELFILKIYRVVFDLLFNFLIYMNYSNSKVLPDLTGKINHIIDRFPGSLDLGIKENRDFYKQYLNHYIADMTKYIGDLPNDFPMNNVPYTEKKIDFSQLIPSIETLNEKYFVSTSMIEVADKDYSVNVFSEIRSMLQDIDLFQNKYNILSAASAKKESVIQVSFGNFSAGEEQLIETFSQIKSIVESLKSDSSKQNFILLLDEYEKYLHPEWARQFSSFLFKLLGVYKYSCSFQIVLTSHSPYLISDLPKENIRLIYKDEKTGKREVSIPKHSFASNYYDILSDSFFLEDTIGEFAKQKINSWITELNKLKKNKLKIFLDDDQQKIRKINEIKELISLDVSNKVFIGTVHKKLLRIAEIKELINIVDDLFIRNKLLELAEDVRAHILKKPENSKISRIKRIDQEIERLEAMKKQLREESEK